MYAVIASGGKQEKVTEGQQVALELLDGDEGSEISLTPVLVVDGETVQNRWQHMAEVPATTPASDRMSKELKRLGFRFVGTTICYSLMQACGLVNDHLVTCYRHAELR